MWRSVTVWRAAIRMARSVACEAGSLRMRSGLNFWTTLPSGPTTSRTICGRYSLPPFASAAYALMSWIGVTTS